MELAANFAISLFLSNLNSIYGEAFLQKLWIRM